MKPSGHAPILNTGSPFYRGMSILTLFNDASISTIGRNLVPGGIQPTTGGTPSRTTDPIFGQGMEIPEDNNDWVRYTLPAKDTDSSIPLTYGFRFRALADGQSTYGYFSQGDTSTPIDASPFVTIGPSGAGTTMNFYRNGQNNALTPGLVVANALLDYFIVWDGTEWKCYENGLLVDSGGTSFGVLTGQFIFTGGSYYREAHARWDYFARWTGRALNAAEIATWRANGFALSVLQPRLQYIPVPAAAAAEEILLVPSDTPQIRKPD